MTPLLRQCIHSLCFGIWLPAEKPWNLSVAEGGKEIDWKVSELLAVPVSAKFLDLASNHCSRASVCGTEPKMKQKILCVATTLWYENNLPMFWLDALVILRTKVKLGVKTCTYLQLHTQGYSWPEVGAWLLLAPPPVSSWWPSSSPAPRNLHPGWGWHLQETGRRGWQKPHPDLRSCVSLSVQL